MHLSAALAQSKQGYHAGETASVAIQRILNVAVHCAHSDSSQPAQDHLGKAEHSHVERHQRHDGHAVCKRNGAARWRRPRDLRVVANGKEGRAPCGHIFPCCHIVGRSRHPASLFGSRRPITTAPGSTSWYTSGARQARHDEGTTAAQYLVASRGRRENTSRSSIRRGGELRLLRALHSLRALCRLRAPGGHGSGRRCNEKQCEPH